MQLDFILCALVYVQSIHIRSFSLLGWGGNYFMFGGDVKGGVIKGDYPKSFLPSDPFNIGRGRLLPTTSWDALFYGLTQWMGISDQGEIDVSQQVVEFITL